jgi:hypothetical protein
VVLAQAQAVPHLRRAGAEEVSKGEGGVEIELSTGTGGAHYLQKASAHQ